MQFSELFLRLGLAMVGWMSVFAYVLWLAVLRKLGCEENGDEMHRLLIGVAPFIVGFAFVLRLTRPLKEIHSIMRWLAVPLFVLVPTAAMSIWEVWQRTLTLGMPICGEPPVALWQQIWPPAQTITLLIVVWGVVQVWLQVKADSADPN